MKYRICATVSAPTPHTMAPKLGAALSRADYAELRLDHMRPDRIPRALEAAKRRMRKIICTIRPRSEGGSFAGTEDERVSLLELAAGYGPYLLDVEYDTIRKPRLAARLAGADLLVSWHDFERTPGAASLDKRLGKMAKYADVVKMVSTARTPADATRMMGLYAARGDTPLVSFAMGEYGRPSRILCPYLGSPFTYASLGRPAAPGQMNIAQMRRASGLRV